MFVRWLDFFIKNKKKEVKVKKLIIKKLYGGKLNDVNTPKKIKNIDSIYIFFFNLILKLQIDILALLLLTFFYSLYF